MRNRRTEEQWRQASVESRKGRRSDDTPVSIDSVGEAVALAREAFPDTLLIKLNSRSNENTPFTTLRRCTTRSPGSPPRTATETTIAYGFRTSGALEVALYHALGDLPEPELTHRFC